MTENVIGDPVAFVLALLVPALLLALPLALLAPAALVLELGELLLLLPHAAIATTLAVTPSDTANARLRRTFISPPR
jgi:hypothetical protein